MKIIQSFAQFDNWTPRLYSGDEKKKYYNFYSFLLSYLTLKKYYGHVTMYCNNKAKNGMLKYIPYDEVNVIENPNSTLFWSYYKVLVMSTMKEDFVHFDSDVFIFGDVLKPFLENDEIDITVQNIIPKHANYVQGYVEQFYDYVTDTNIIAPEKYDGRCMSCGTIGMRKKHIEGYIEICEKMKKGFIEAGTGDLWYIGMASEELAFYLYYLNNEGMKIHEILPYEDILKYEDRGAGDLHNYTHMFLDTKYQSRYVKAIRMKTINDFPESMEYIEKYENEIMKNVEIYNEII